MCVKKPYDANVIDCHNVMESKLGNLSNKWEKGIGAAGDRTPGFSHAKRTLYHWVTTPHCHPLKGK